MHAIYLFEARNDSSGDYRTVISQLDFINCIVLYVKSLEVISLGIGHRF